MNKKSVISFRIAYLLFLCLLMVLAAAAIIYVRMALEEYRDSLPERVVEAQIELLRKGASDGSLWKQYPMPESETGKFEQNIDVKAYYTGLFSGNGVSYALKAGSDTDTEKTYNILNGDNVIAEVSLRKQGEERTKLFILSMADWVLKDVKLTIEAHSYRIDVPYDFNVTVNGIALGDDDRAMVNGTFSGYEIKGLFFAPSISITDKDGQQAEYRISGSNVKVVLFDYSLTLPRTLYVTVDGEAHTGDVLSGGMVRHDIRRLSQPDVKISDLFGNTLSYEGGNQLDLTYFSVTAPGNFDIAVDGASVPEEAREAIENVSLDNIRKYDPSVPVYYNYCIAVLKKDAAVEIKDLFGHTVEYDKEATTLDLTESGGLASIPDDIAAEVDVLTVAKRWSLFMSKDLEGSNYGFYNISKDLIEGSPVYDSAKKWVTSIDITFTSTHTLGNPPFSAESATNFTRLSENSFYVDVYLVKDMYVRGALVPETLDNRLYFVKYDDTKDGIDNPVWKLADMS